MCLRWMCISLILLCLCLISLSAMDKRLLVGAELDASVYLADGGSSSGGGEFMDDDNGGSGSGSDSNHSSADDSDSSHDSGGGGGGDYSSSSMSGSRGRGGDDSPPESGNASRARFSSSRSSDHRRDEHQSEEDDRTEHQKRKHRYDDDEDEHSQQFSPASRHRTRSDVADAEESDASSKHQGDAGDEHESPDLEHGDSEGDDASYGGDTAATRDSPKLASPSPSPSPSVSARTPWPTTSNSAAAQEHRSPSASAEATESAKRSLLNIGKRIVAGEGGGRDGEDKPAQNSAGSSPPSPSVAAASVAAGDAGNSGGGGGGGGGGGSARSKQTRWQREQDADMLAALFPTTTPAPTHNNDLIFVSTIDGYFYAVEKYTGVIKWKIKEDPVVQVAFSDKSFLLPDPTNGNLYVVGSSESDVAIKKLPYSIPELVSMSPTRSSDGTFCTGFKRDFWLSVDARTGFKTDVFSSDRGSQKCPNNAKDFSSLPEETVTSGGARYDQLGQSILIGRSQHTLVVYDRLSGAMLWNVTYNDYSAHSITEPGQERLQSGDPSDLKYLTSSQSAYLAVVSAGQLLWSLNETQLSSPIVAIYSVASSQVAGDHHRSLVRQLYSPFGDEALRILVDSLRTQRQFPANIGRDSFQPSLFIGASGQHWYALSTYTLSTAKLKPPCRPRTPLLEGPVDASGSSTPIGRDLTPAEIGGLYAPPELGKKARLPIDKRLSDRSSPHGVIELSQDRSANANYYYQQDLKVIAISVLATLLAVLVPFIVWQWHRTIQALNDSQRGSSGAKASATNLNNNDPAGGSAGTNHSDSTLELLGRAAGSSTGALPSGWRKIGNISYDPRHVLGRGCEGTLVYKGRFDDRDVAVKRMLPDCFSVADKEVQLLRLSDQHLNVVRYYCTEQDAHFRYIALELCEATVVDYAKEANPEIRFGLEPAAVLRQALQGLHHLHNLDIVHRDVKPTNLLLCKNFGSGGAYRTVISDFGLCKRLSPGRVSFSKRSGLTGTEGWIAPEMFEAESTSATCAVDVFSVGCVCYYVLSRGRHPFGEALNRQRNILDGNYNLGSLKLDHLANDMIMKMIEHRAMDRLSIDGALKHPFFWTVEEQIHFLTEASDRTDKLPMDDPLMERMESCAPSICGLDWSDRLDTEVYHNLVTFRGYRTHRLVDLLRAIRNKRNHFRELDPSVQQLLGRAPEQYMNYFADRYPQLLTYVYNVLVAVKLEHSFERYYSSIDPDYFPKYYRAFMKQAFIRDSQALGTSLSSNQIVKPSSQQQQQQQQHDFSPKPTRRGVHVGHRGSSGGSDAGGSYARHVSDSELGAAVGSAAAAAAAAASAASTASLVGSGGGGGSGSPSLLFRSPAMQRLQRKAELQQQQQQAALQQQQRLTQTDDGDRLSSASCSSAPPAPPGLSRSQENLLAARQLSANWNNRCLDSDQPDPTVIFSADSYALFRIDSYPQGTPIPVADGPSAQPTANGADAGLTEPACCLKVKKKTRRGKKAKKSASAAAPAAVSASAPGASGAPDDADEAEDDQCDEVLLTQDALNA